MVDTEILERAVRKAIDGGWHVYRGDFNGIEINPLSGEVMLYFERGALVNVFQVIFSHGFAKALWHEETAPNGLPEAQALITTKVGWTHEETAPGTNWQAHLQCMAISKDPIGYLGENI